MGLDYMRDDARHANANSPRSSVDLLERDLPPLPELAYVDEVEASPLVAEPFDVNDVSDLDDQDDLEDEELAEFVEFFTGEQRIIPSSALQAVVQPATSGARGRVRRATERVIHVAAMRPVVHVPARVPRTLRARVLGAWASAETEAPVEQIEQDEQTAPRTLKLPPLWLLANLLIVSALVIGFFPQIMTAGAAAGCKWYRVQPGDTLSKLSHRYGVSINQLASANHIANINLIYVDQNMCIPLMPLASSNQPAPAPASHPPTYSAPSDVSAFINYTLPYARQASQQTGWPVSMILAQWGLETGWRTHTYTGYNWGNCGAMPGEPTIGGINKPGSPAAFAYANSPAQGLAEYVHVAHLGYYTNVAHAAQNGADAAARALGQSPWDWGHYTNRGIPGSSIISIMRVYNLYYYDTH